MPRLQNALMNWLLVILCSVLLGQTVLADDSKTNAAKPPAVGEAAKDFKLSTLDDKEIRLHELTKAGPVVVVVLRGYPGYECPLCTAQVAGLRAEAKAFESAGAKVVLVYPGPAAELKARAKEFLKGEMLPAPLTLVLDPDYAFVNAYGLRWDAPMETAYPSTFVVGRDNKVLFSKVSKKHGGRSKVNDILESLSKSRTK